MQLEIQTRARSRGPGRLPRHDRAWKKAQDSGRLLQALPGSCKVGSSALISFSRSPARAARTGTGPPLGPGFAPSGSSVSVCPGPRLQACFLLRHLRHSLLFRGARWGKQLQGKGPQHLEAPPWGELTSESAGWGRPGEEAGSLPGWAPLLS